MTDLVDGDVVVVVEHSRPHGIRDRTGMLLFFNEVQRFPGQDARYQRELKRQSRLVAFIADALRAANDTLSENDLDSVQAEVDEEFGEMF